MKNSLVQLGNFCKSLSSVGVLFWALFRIVPDDKLYEFIAFLFCRVVIVGRNSCSFWGRQSNSEIPQNFYQVKHRIWDRHSDVTKRDFSTNLLATLWAKYVSGPSAFPLALPLATKFARNEHLSRKDQVQEMEATSVSVTTPNTWVQNPPCRF